MEFNEQVLKDNYFSEAIEKIKAIVSIPSYAGSASKDAPYGEGVLKVLHYAVDLAKSLGFKTFIDSENKYGYVEYGEGEEIFAILGHLDVVPPGNIEEWNVHPFKPEIIDDILYGRGVLDDKGPTIIILYCLKYLKDYNYQPNRRIRLIFGLDEETTWDSIDTYMKKEGTPDFGFTPDGLFPLTYAEKGIIDLDFVGPGSNQVRVSAGDAYNVTCAFSTVENIDLASFVEIAERNKYRLEKTDNKVTILGKPAHGSHPEEGINAGLRTLLVLKELKIDHPLVNFVGDVLKEDTELRKYFGQYDDESGAFTINVGLVTINEKESYLGCNVRFPVHTTKDDVLNKLTEILAPYKLTTRIEHYDKPLHMPLDSPIVTELMTIYQTVTKDKISKPIAIGGGTYARAMPNCVAFGAIFNEATSTEHQYNESIKIEELWHSMLIYVRAIETLGTIEKIKN
ncbi:Sapep family Mn(2+)-dependent dipeptidase [Spiroplasma platyhelix]|uniref:M20 family metallopeptidase n=1 Tax=Spiroplasma platyhelix PALS-1 TaxID=1276218 RepID=A0A846TPM1_9MOLU|nr:Sapep family Mn(2+)-dependent dipeptidase [Spiroplasma platyhelix]MBE4703847.1 putative dipeptidase [Spiroplasma platyhelix PALS-1]NKE38220.1 M20 family metallopeptidase [Spiroplasma platyhelix PALS-1]UJB29105.1 dipeptidase PepV [Spiroplasma platyhelix PALS-1]